MESQILEAPRDIIDRLRLEYSPDGHSKVSSIINSALEILSTELYDTSTHFLLELLQNADDNNYDPRVAPGLHFTYTPGFLRVDCNEVGFNAANVEAICNIRSSTKSGQDHAERTGEKGIGFKSVFKVADVVWICSRGFAFKFDKMRPFGIIAPIWEEFPQPTLEGHTSFLLHLDDRCDTTDLVDSLLNLDQTYLLFTRRLRQITVKVNNDDQVQTRDMRRRDETDSEGPTTIIDVDEQVFKYITSTRQVENLPNEPKRLGSQTSELVLAFPVNKDTAATEDTMWNVQTVHNVLPIGKYGLKFIVQGDFLLTANRRHIDASSSWNIALRDALVDAFIASVDRLNCGSMRFIWPAFVPVEQISAFFEPSRAKILEKLAKKSVIESISGTLVPPSTLYRVTECFADSGNQPLSLYKGTEDTYISPQYPDQVFDVLLRLGVDELSEEDFLDHLERMVLDEEDRFRAQPDHWHSDLARALIPLMDEDDLNSIAVRLPIIPIMNGKWVTASSGPRLFEDDSKDGSDLDDLLILHSIRIIQPAAAAEPNRRHLWSALNIQTINRLDICQYIIDAHAHPASHPDIVGWTRAHLIAHARFLHSSHWRPSDPVDLWIGTIDGKYDRSSRTYIFEGSYNDESVSKVIHQLRECRDFSILHDDYLAITTAEEDSHSEEPDETHSNHPSEYESETPSEYESETDEEESRSEASDIYLEDLEANLIGRASQELEEFREWRTLRSDWDNLLHRSTHIPERSSLHGHDEWNMYLGEVLQVAKLPRLAVTSRDPEDSGAYRMSDEFRFLFSTCDVSDVLHLLISNWNKYSRFIEVSGTGDKDRDEELEQLRDAIWPAPDHEDPEDHAFTRPGLNSMLLQDLRNTLVMTSAGMAPLKTCVLAGIDSRFEDDTEICLPTLKIGQYSAEVKARLKSFSISVEADAKYYIKCLRALERTEMPPSYDTVAQIYAEIQSHYHTQMRFIRQLFHSHDLVYLFSKPPTADRATLPSRVSIPQAIEKGVDLVGMYPTCQSPFRSLCDPDHLQIDILVRSVSSVHSSQPAMEIINHLKSVSQRLAGVEPKQAAAIVKLLRPRKIFPVSDNTKTFKAQRSDRMLCADDRSWFISDGYEFIDCFVGRVPLLTTSPGTAAALKDLFSALKLDSRKLSKAVVQRASPKGRLRFLAERTAFLRSRARFVSVLLPEDHCNYTVIRTQIKNMSVFSATDVAITYTLVTAGSEIVVNGPPGEAAILDEGSSLRLFIAEEMSQHFSTSLQWFELLVQHWKIGDSTSIRLLFAALTNPNYNQVCKSFASQGHDFDYIPTDLDVAEERYASRHGNLAPLTTSSDRGPKLSDRTNQQQRHKSGGTVQTMTHSSHRKALKPSRQIPLLEHLIYGPEMSMEDFGDPDSPRGGAAFFREAVSTDAFPTFSPYIVARDGYKHLRYIGESIVSHMLQDKLGQLYDPVQYWTSSLRSRAGLPTFRGVDDLDDPHKNHYPLTPSPFTFKGKIISQVVWNLLSVAFLEYPLRDGVSSGTTFHFEVAIFADENEGRFFWDHRQLELIHEIQSRQYHGSYKCCRNDIMVLVKIHDAFTTPRFEFVVDPWYCLLTSRLRIAGDQRAAFRGYKGVINQRFPADTDLVIRQLGLDVPPLRLVSQHPADGICYCEVSAIALQNATGRSSDTTALARQPRSQKLRPTKFCYLPLREGEIRLFVLFPGDYDDQLRGAICHMPFDNAGPYRALSYVWGPDHQSERNLVTPQGVLKIKASLGSALQRIRQKKKELVLWVDSVCINQEDTKEKVQQILHLPRIFQGATSTLAVLATDDRSYQAVGILLQIAALNLYGSDFSSWPKNLVRPRAPWVKHGLPDSNSAFWQDVSYLFNRPWFRRAWIVQESIAARTVQLICGKWILDWNDLYRAMEVVDRKLGMFAFAESWRPFMVLTEHREWEASSQRWPLLRLVQTFRYVRTGKYQRDRFFSLLGLASDGDISLFKPDYDSPFEMVVRRFAQGFVQSGNGMELLYDAGLARQEGKRQFPSWVPDWTKEAADQDRLSSTEGRGSNFSASGQLSSSIFYNHKKDTLVVSGGVWDEIDCISRFSNEPSQRSRYFKELDSMIEACKHFESHEQQRLKETVPIAGALYPESGLSSPISIAESYSAYRRVLRKEELRARSLRSLGKKAKTELTSARTTTEQSPEITSIREKSKAYASLLDKYIVGWRFVTTKKGRCGIAPNDVLPGDEVVILSGGKVPFLIRNGLLPGGGFFLVGQCYIDGMMFGEVVKEFESQKWLPWDIHLF